MRIAQLIIITNIHDARRSCHSHQFTALCRLLQKPSTANYRELLTPQQKVYRYVEIKIYTQAVHQQSHVARPLFSFIQGQENQGLVPAYIIFVLQIHRQFYRVVNWPLISKKTCILVRTTQLKKVDVTVVLTQISGQLTSRKTVYLQNKSGIGCSPDIFRLYIYKRKRHRVWQRETSSPDLFYQPKNGLATPDQSEMETRRSTELSSQEAFQLLSFISHLVS